MPSRLSHIPTARERQAMQFIRSGGVHDISDHSGNVTIKRLLEKGWIEPVELGHNQYRVTAAGDAAAKAKIPE